MIKLACSSFPWLQLSHQWSIITISRLWDTIIVTCSHCMCKSTPWHLHLICISFTYMEQSVCMCTVIMTISMIKLHVNAVPHQGCINYWPLALWASTLQTCLIGQERLLTMCSCFRLAAQVRWRWMRRRIGLQMLWMPPALQLRKGLCQEGELHFCGQSKLWRGSRLRVKIKTWELTWCGKRFACPARPLQKMLELKKTLVVDKVQ